MAITAEYVSNMFNQVDRSQLWPVVVRRNALISLLMGTNDPGQTIQGKKPSFVTSDNINGNQIEFRQNVGLGTNVMLGTDGTSEAVAYDPSAYLFQTIGSSLFDLAHMITPMTQPGSEFERVRGSEAKTKSWASDLYKIIVNTMLQQPNGLSAGINSVNAPARGNIGGWLYAVSDGIADANEAAFAVYGGVDRSQSGNAEYRSIVNNNGGTPGALSLADIQTVQSQLINNGAEDLVGVAGTNLYTKIQTLVQSYTHQVIDVSSTLSTFGTRAVRFSGISFVLEGKLDVANGGTTYTQETLGLLDPTTWRMFDKHFSTNGADMGQTMSFTRLPQSFSAYALNIERWFQFLCGNTARNGKLTNRT